MVSVRAPRCVVSVAGAEVEVLEANVHVSIHQSADTFYAKLPLDDPSGLDEKFWSDTQAPLATELKGCNDINSGGFTSLLIGQVDEAQIILHERAVAIKGRDKTASLIDKKSSKLWRGQGDKDIITELAGEVGLTVQFDADPSPPNEKAGLQFDQDYSEISDLDSAWNVIVGLARRAGCIAFVNGTVLHIQPIDAAANGVFTINYQRPTADQLARSDAVLLFCSRNLNLAKTTSVKVQSYRHKQGDTVTSEVQSEGKTKSATADRLIYQNRGANLTKQQADRVAKSHLKETLSHEREIRADSLPGDVTIDKSNTVKLTGTGTMFDQDYILSDIVHHFAMNGGYQMDISAHGRDAARGEPEQLQ